MKRISGVSERLLDCAKEEFLEKGFQNASIRGIAKKAATSPRAVYTRFPNKEGLFDAIVQPVIDGLTSRYENYGSPYWEAYKNGSSVPGLSLDPAAVYIDMIDYIYDHQDEFILILNSLDGTRHTALVEHLTEMNYQHLEEYRLLQKENGENTAIMMKVYQMLTHSFYTALFEPLSNHMNREEAHFYIRKLCRFFVAGIAKISQND